MAYGLHEQLQDRKINATEFIREIAAAVEEAIDVARSASHELSSRNQDTQCANPPDPLPHPFA
tara:strand:- start:1575 stop:1763 length:189 start_codon:yes stop_codon:yes gene_type:complete